MAIIESEEMHLTSMLSIAFISTFYFSFFILFSTNFLTFLCKKNFLSFPRFPSIPSFFPITRKSRKSWRCPSFPRRPSFVPGRKKSVISDFKDIVVLKATARTF